MIPELTSVGFVTNICYSDATMDRAVSKDTFSW